MEDRCLLSSLPLATHYDFGTAKSPVEAGYAPVAPTTVYNAAQGYGWQSGRITGRDRGGASALDRDLNFTTDGTFVVDLPNGTYAVDAILGDRGAYAHDQVGVFLEGTLADTVSTAARQLVSRSYQVEVSDGQLTLRLKDLGGRDVNACIEALRIVPTEGASAAAPKLWWPTLPEIPGAWFTEAAGDSRGIYVYTVNSPYESTATKIRVLLPTTFSPDRTYRVVYVLPVEAGDGRQFGDGLETIRKLGLQSRYNDVIFVSPTFSRIPWYVNHVSNQTMWQETHFLSVVVPFVEHCYPVLPQPEGRLLLGYSKSGYGAFSMLLRHPDVFGRALAWDSPLATLDPGDPYGPLPIAGSMQNLEKYRVTTLLGQDASLLQGSPARLFMMGYSYDSMRQSHQTVDALMRRLGIPHVYIPGTYRAHLWNSGWLGDAVNLILS